MTIPSARARSLEASLCPGSLAAVRSGRPPLVRGLERRELPRARPRLRADCPRSARHHPASPPSYTLVGAPIPDVARGVPHTPILRRPEAPEALGSRPNDTTLPQEAFSFNPARLRLTFPAAVALP